MVRKEETTMETKKENYPQLKQCSNETLLDMYYEYRMNIHRYQLKLEQKLDKVERDYYYDKLVWDGEYYYQIRLEILSRMMGMEID